MVGRGIDHCGRDGGLEAFLQTDRLCGDLDVCGPARPITAGFVFDGNNGTVGADLDDVSDTHQTEVLMPDRKGSQRSYPRAAFRAGIMDALVQQGSADGVDVIGVALLKQDQTGLAGTVRVALQRREGDLLHRVGCGHPRIRVSVTPAGRSVSSTATV